jgi:hypothetical protein
MEYVVVPAMTWRNLMSDVKFIKETILPLARNYKPSKWMSESEVIELTDLKSRRLLDLRKKGTFNWSTGSGRKIKYLRVDVEAYINNNSTLRK